MNANSLEKSGKYYRMGGTYMRYFAVEVLGADDFEESSLAMTFRSETRGYVTKSTVCVGH